VLPTGKPSDSTTKTALRKPNVQKLSPAPAISSTQKRKEKMPPLPLVIFLFFLTVQLNKPSFPLAILIIHAEANSKVYSSA
jgi:hypothetical protein